MEKLQYKLDAFEGPLDLLLHLISKHKLDINDIAIFELVEQYIEYVRRMEEADMEIASEFVEMAARLVYIKTVSLLPKYEEAQKLKEELTGELIEYRDCKIMAEKLSQQTEGFNHFERKPMVLPEDLRYKRIHDAAELIDYYLSAVGRGKEKLPPPIESFSAIIKKKIVSVNSRIVFIYRRLLKSKKVKFSYLFEESKSVSEMVATFLAVLELIKANKILVEGEKENSIVSMGERNKTKKGILGTSD